MNGLNSKWCPRPLQGVCGYLDRNVYNIRTLRLTSNGIFKENTNIRMCYLYSSALLCEPSTHRQGSSVLSEWLVVVQEETVSGRLNLRIYHTHTHTNTHTQPYTCVLYQIRKQEASSYYLVTKLTTQSLTNNEWMNERMKEYILLDNSSTKLREKESFLNKTLLWPWKRFKVMKTGMKL